MAAEPVLAERSLTSRVRSGVGWTSLSTLSTQGLALVRSVVLARLLTKDDFGLFGMAATLLGALTVLTNMGLDNTVISQKFESEAELKTQLNTLWTVELGRRLLLTLFLLVLIVPTAQFYGDRRLLAILPLISLTPLVQGLQNIGLVLLRKSVHFAKVVWFEQTSAWLSTAVTLLLAWQTRNVWALVWGQLLSGLLASLLSYCFHPYRPRLAFEKEAFLRAFHLGRYLLLIGIMTYITTTADNVVVGKICGAGVLGAYVVAYSIANLPVSIFSSMLTSVLFPAYSELAQSRREELEQAVVRVFTVSPALFVLIVTPLVLLSEEVVRLLFGNKWGEAGSLLRILLFVGFFRGMAHLYAPLTLGLNLLKQESRAKMGEALLFLVLLPPLTLRLGAAGAAWAGAVIYLIAFLVRFWIARRVVPEASKQIPKLCGKAIFAGVCGGLIGMLVLQPISGLLWRILVGGSVSLLVTAGLLWLLSPALQREVRGLRGGE